MRRPLALAALVLSALLIAAACGDSDDDASADTTAAPAASTTSGTADSTATSAAPGTSAAAGATLAELDPERCAANEAAGTITYPTAFSYAAAVTILEPIVAEAEGYFDDVCLDVDIVPSFAGQAAAAMSSGQAQISEIGSFGEMVTLNVRSDTDFVTIGHWGKTAVQALVVPTETGITELPQIEGTVMGIKTDLPPPLQVMLAREGVERGTFEEVLLEGFDPIAHLDLGIDSLPVYKSNEPRTIDEAGIEYTLFDPLDYDVPSSFGIVYTTTGFLADHPTAVEDFVRAMLRGWEFARADPAAAVAHAVELINTPEANFFSTQEAEEFRWITESDLVAETTPPDQVIGELAPDLLGAEIESMVEVALLEEMPDWESMIDASVVEGLYDGDTLIWPGSTDS
jgi:NitT/TauT family transport system substrate-binding protein